MALLIIYLIGVILSFLWLTLYLKEPYEVSIFTAVFYPVLLVLGLVTFVAMLVAALLFWCVETIKHIVRSNAK